MADNNIIDNNTNTDSSETVYDIINNIDEIGAAKLRKITCGYKTMELLLLASKFAVAGYDKKLWSLLSRVYEDKKGFSDTDDVSDAAYFDKDKAPGLIDTIVNSSVASEYVLQLFTSFAIPEEYMLPLEKVSELIERVDKKRINIVAYYIAAYKLEKHYYKYVFANKEVLKILTKSISSDRMVLLYENIIDNESKEFITGAIRTLQELKPSFRYKSIDNIKRLTEKIFESKEVFFTTKIMFCITFNVPKTCLPDKRDIYKILKICVNYEERLSREFINKYEIDFAYSDDAMCRYYIANKKAGNEKLLVSKFANHLVRIEDENIKAKLLRNAFKRGGYFRMYAGCMQDGKVDETKLHRFHYSDEQIEWVRTLAGLHE